MKKNKIKIGIKIGSKLLVDKKGGVNKRYLKDVVSQIVYLKNKGHQVFLVTSGAIACSGTNNIERSLNLKAAIGQVNLMNYYKIFFEKFGYDIAQFLPSGFDIESKNSLFFSILNESFSDSNVVPIVNYNDPMDNKEISAFREYADNDNLFKELCLSLKIDCAIIGFFGTGFLDNSGNKFDKIFASDYKSLLYFANGGNDYGNGSEGMKTKIKVLAELANNDIYSVLSPGREKKFVLRSVSKEKCFGTIFLK